MKRFLTTFLIVLSGLCGFAENRALLVGIGRYKVGTGWSTIHGDADVDLLSMALKKKGYGDIIILKNNQAIKSDIVNALKTLAERCKSGDKVYFHFSGHGQPMTDLNGDEGEKGFDESIVPYDAYKLVTSRNGKEFYNGENHLSDDELNPLFAAIKGKIGKDGQLFIAVDACFSEDIQRAPGSEEAGLPPTRGTSDRLNIRKTSFLIPRPKSYPPGAKMFVVSACKSDERNFEYRASDGKLYGSLTYFIFTQLATSTDFEKWCKNLQSNTGTNRIFQTFQHPQIKIIK